MTKLQTKALPLYGGPVVDPGHADPELNPDSPPECWRSGLGLDGTRCKIMVFQAGHYLAYTAYWGDGLGLC